MKNNILEVINNERISFDLEKSHLLQGGSKYYMVTPAPEGSLDNLVETLMLFQEEGLDAWYNLNSNSIIHQFSH